MITILFDCETTGLPKSSACDLSLQPEIIEYAGVKINEDFEILDQLEFMCKPTIMPLPPIITKITGIKDADLVDKPPFSNNLDSIKKFHAGVDLFVSHNIDFDRRLMLFEFMRLKCVDEFEWNDKNFGCTVESTFHIKNKRLHLVDLYEMATGSPLSQTHRAMDDVLALLECFKWMKREGIPI